MPQFETIRGDVDDEAVTRAIGQFLALARAANVSFDLVNDQLMMRGARVRWEFWPPVRACLDEIGVPAISAFFRRTTPQQREQLLAAA